jgi:predicted GNAT family acetyltransferase
MTDTIDAPGVDDGTPEVRDHASAHRFEIWVDGQMAGFTEYHVLGGLVSFTHTEVDDRYEGQGLGSTLVRGALDVMRERAASVAPHCSFVRDWISRHPEYLDLVPGEVREEFDLPPASH